MGPGPQPGPGIAPLPDRPAGRPAQPPRSPVPLVPLLALCLVGILAGHTSFAATAQFGRLRRHRLGHALGFTAGRRPGGWGVPSLDGRTARGSRDGDVPGTHLPAAYASHVAAVAQLRVEATASENKAALRLPGVLPLPTGPW